MKRILLFSLLMISIVAGAGLLLPSGDGATTIAKDIGLPTDIKVMATPLQLDLSVPSDSAAVKVQYAGGWALSSDHEDFGGFSGLLVDADTKKLLSINDKGDWWQSPFDVLSGTPPTGGMMNGYALASKADKVDLDAESLIRYGGGFLVSFEHNHRMDYVAEPGAKPTIPKGLATIDFAGVSKNGGMEAIAHLPTGDVLAFAERGEDVGGRLKAWLVSEAQASDLYFAAPKNFAPTDAAVLPGGDVLVLLRKYSAIEGVAIKVHHIQADSIVAGAVLKGTEILHLTPEGPVDNMEGLDVVPMGENTVRFVMIADDNFNPLQRTLLMMFDYTYQ